MMLLAGLQRIFKFIQWLSAYPKFAIVAARRESLR